MKILLASSGSGSRGGGEIFLQYLGKALSDRGHETIVWVPRHARMNELADKCAAFSTVVRSEYRNTYDYRTRCVATAFNWPVPRRIAREWQDLAPDLVHINKQNLEDGLDLLSATERSGLPSICTVHLTQPATYLGAKLAWLRDAIARRRLRKYKGTLVAVQRARSHVLDEFLANPSRTVTVFNGVPGVDGESLGAIRESKRRELGLAPTDRLVLGVGRLVEQKRPFEFLRIAEELHRRSPAARFLWVGDGELADRWKSAVAHAGLDLVVGLTGWCSDVTPYLIAGDLLLHVAQFEGFPLAVIEAMAVGLPCAVSEDLAREIPLLHDGAVLPADDVAALAHAIADGGGLAAAAANGQRLYRSTLSASKMAEAYESLYADLLAGNHE
jgi:glycosyltransferase involved in cell wall biosynthesis